MPRLGWLGRHLELRRQERAGRLSVEQGGYSMRYWLNREYVGRTPLLITFFVAALLTTSILLAKQGEPPSVIAANTILSAQVFVLTSWFWRETKR